jgi:hypothetical protein
MIKYENIKRKKQDNVQRHSPIFTCHLTFLYF